MRIALFIPCFVDTFFPQVGIATVRILQHLGLRPEYPEDQTCCGQAHFNAGNISESKDIANHFCEVFNPFDIIVCPSGSCTTMVRNHYPKLLDDKVNTVSKKTFELCEFLVGFTDIKRLSPRLNGRAALHIGCHSQRLINISQAAHTITNQIQDLTIVDLPSDTWCCGFGGTFAVKFPELSTAIGTRKLATIQDANVDYLLSTDSSCLLHLGGILSKQQQATQHQTKQQQATQQSNPAKPQLMHIAEALASGLT